MILSVRNLIKASAKNQTRTAKYLFVGVPGFVASRIRGFPSIRLTAIFAPVILFSVSGCTMEGDFGVPRQSKLYEYVTLRLLAAEGERNGEEVSDLSLTYEESELRDAAFHFSVSLPQSMSRKNRRSGTPSYADHLKKSGFRYGAAQVSEIQGQIDADFSAFQRFQAVAKLVIHADQIRELELVENSAAYTDFDRRMTLSRIKENQTVIESTFANLAERFADYDYAVARSRIEQPLADTANVEALLNLFRERVVFSQRELRRIVELGSSKFAYQSIPYDENRPIPLKP